MNSLERKMIDQLFKLKEVYGVEGVKAEFEAEGTRTEELIRLRELTLFAGVTLTLKIGGCEAVRDMYDARSIGIDHLVGPMVESPFALAKYVDAVERVFPQEELANIQVLFNVETIEAVNNWNAFLASAVWKKASGIVIGRGDLVESLGHARSLVDSEEIFKICEELLVSAKSQGKVTVMGGSVTVASVPFIRRLPKGCLDRYETRKVCFKTEDGLRNNPEKGITEALEFELMWMENKRGYYSEISQEDDKRIAALKQRKGQQELK